MRLRRRRERACAHAARRRAHADPLLPAHTFKLGRPAVPIFADLLVLHGPGDPAAWALGWLLDGLGAGVPLPSLGRLGLRSAARATRPAALPGRVHGAMESGDPRLSEKRQALPLPLPPFMDWRCSTALKRLDPWPNRAGPPHLRLEFEGGRFLIVEARYYESIGAGLLAGAIRALEAAGAAHDVISVAGALEIPVGMAIALDAAKAAGRPRRRHSARLRHPRRNLSLRDRRRGVGARADGHVD